MNRLLWLLVLLALSVPPVVAQPSLQRLAPLPVTIVESPEQERENAGRDGKSDAHEAADLVAQQHAADGAQRAAGSAERQEWSNVLIGVTGLVTSSVAILLSLWTATRSERTGRRQLRAYVNLSRFSWQSIRDRQTNVVVYRFTPVWRNSGVTRTRGLRLSSYVVVRNTPLPLGYEFAPPQHDYAPVTLEPGGEVFGDTIDLVGHDLVSTEHGILHIYLWGTAKYLDVFSRQVRETRYCRKVVLRTGDPTQHHDDSNNVVSFGVNFHMEFNGTEDDIGFSAAHTKAAA